MTPSSATLPPRAEQESNSGGLHAPSGPLLRAAESPRRMSWRTIVLQVIGFLLGLGLLGWALRMAFADPANLENLKRLVTTRVDALAGLAALAVCSLALNGMAFWVTIRPVKRIGVRNVLAVNAVATMAAYLPFKLSLFIRVLAHRRLDGLSYRTLLAWLAAMVGLTLGVLGPLALAALWREDVDALWWATFFGGAALFGVAAVIGGRVARRFRRLDALTLGAGAMLSNPRAVFSNLAIRVADIGSQTGRFMIAGAVLGHALSPTQGVLFATAYFLTGVLSPAGSIGTREGAVMGVGGLALAGQVDLSHLAAMALVVTAAEAATQFVFALIGLAWIRPSRLLLRRSAAGAAGQAADSSVRLAKADQREGDL